MRPQFHYTAERGWINDPHGITVHEGRYHLFHQFVPDSMIWDANCHWGHAIGDDLFSLERRPVALAPGEGDDGVWSGAVVPTANGSARIFYTSTVAPNYDLGRIRTARPQDPGWDFWSKDYAIAAQVPNELDVVTFRDPFVFREQDEWHMLVGASLRDRTAAALLYTSPDLDSWTFSGVAASRSADESAPTWMGSLWECPQLFEIEGKHVLLTSVWDRDVLHYTGYGVGSYHDGRFHADTWARLSFGRSYYAPTFFRDREDRPCLSFWMRGVRDEQAGWSGAHSVPHLLSLSGDRLIATPHPDLNRYAGPAVESAESSTHALTAGWQPTDPDRLVVSHGRQQSLRVEAVKGALVVFGAGDANSMPYSGGPIRLLLDGPTAEISTTDGVLGTPLSAIPGQIKIQTGRGAVTIRPLYR